MRSGWAMATWTATRIYVEDSWVALWISTAVGYATEARPCPCRCPTSSPCLSGRIVTVSPFFLIFLPALHSLLATPPSLPIALCASPSPSPALPCWFSAVSPSPPNLDLVQPTMGILLGNRHLHPRSTTKPFRINRPMEDRRSSTHQPPPVHQGSISCRYPSPFHRSKTCLALPDINNPMNVAQTVMVDAMIIAGTLFVINKTSMSSRVFKI